MLSTESVYRPVALPLSHILEKGSRKLDLFHFVSTLNKGVSYRTSCADPQARPHQRLHQGSAGPISAGQGGGTDGPNGHARVLRRDGNCHPHPAVGCCFDDRRRQGLAGKGVPVRGDVLAEHAGPLCQGGCRCPAAFWLSWRHNAGIRLFHFRVALLMQPTGDPFDLEGFSFFFTSVPIYLELAELGSWILEAIA
jgi:hypothetical protein